jgi:hypothetical protein
MARMRRIHLKVRLIIRESCPPHPYPVNSNFSEIARFARRRECAILWTREIAMRLIWRSSPSPRLLNTVAGELRETKSEPSSDRFSLKGASLFSGNGRAIFVGIVVGAVILSTIGVLYKRHSTHQRQKDADARSAAVATQNISASARSPAAPMVPIDARDIRVSAISLGEPRLAIVNGKQVTEGESITLPALNQPVAVKLRVLKIADGRIELTDGTHAIVVRLEVQKAPRQKP